jgi:hypothetical protein
MSYNASPHLDTVSVMRLLVNNSEMEKSIKPKPE